MLALPAWAEIARREAFVPALEPDDPGSVEGNRWAFSRPGRRAVGRGEPAVDVWTRLVGVCAGRARTLRLYVDGVQEAEAEDTDPMSATGPIVIGRASYGGQAVDFFPGAVRDVRVFDRALTAARIKKLG